MSLSSSPGGTLSQPLVCHQCFSPPRRFTCATPPDQPQRQLICQFALLFKLIDWLSASLSSEWCKTFEHCFPTWQPVIDAELSLACLCSLFSQITCLLSVPNHKLSECLPVADSAGWIYLPVNSHHGLNVLQKTVSLDLLCWIIARTTFYFHPANWVPALFNKDVNWSCVSVCCIWVQSPNCDSIIGDLQRSSWG